MVVVIFLAANLCGERVGIGIAQLIFDHIGAGSTVQPWINEGDIGTWRSLKSVRARVSGGDDVGPNSLRTASRSKGMKIVYENGHKLKVHFESIFIGPMSFPIRLATTNV